MTTPTPGTPFIYTDLKGRHVRCRFVSVRKAYDPLRDAEHDDPTFWRVQLDEDSAQLGRNAGEVANVAARFLRPDDARYWNPNDDL